jgi:hypothetical protein
MSQTFEEKATELVCQNFDSISRIAQYDQNEFRNDENIIPIFLSPILSLMVIWGNGIIEPFPK